MKKLSVLLLCIVALLGICGCSSQQVVVSQQVVTVATVETVVAVATTKPSQQVREDPTTTEAATVSLGSYAIPWVTKRQVTEPRDTFQIYPAKVPIGNVSLGDNIDTWVNTLVYPARPDFTLTQGEPIGILIDNGFDSEITLIVYYRNPEKTQSDIDTGIDYAAAPTDAKSWVSVSGEKPDSDLASLFGIKGSSVMVTIPANSIMHVPISIKIPKGIKNMPKHWEFDIRVSFIGSIVAASDQRWLITMR